MPNDTQIASTVTQDLAWARHHLFLLVAVGLLVLGGVYGVESILAKRAHEQFLQEQAILQTMVKQNEATQAQTKAQIDGLTQQNVALQQRFDAYTSAIASRDALLLRDREQIKTLPPPQLATKWGESANEPAPAITTNGEFLVPFPLAQKSTDALVTLPVLSKDNADLKSQLTQETQIATNNDQKFKDETKAHESDKGVCKQTVELKDSQIKDLKAAGRKREIIIAVVAALFGFVARH